ncbi:MAG: Hsp70 family protein [Candidatus Riflebacteria bacterium]|nr:Hsp70 family protein [Candidatus Riflebacteria bacterium]
MSQAKSIVGIDLGTTNTVVTHTTISAAEDKKPEIKVFPLIQEFAQGSVEERDILPSFLFERLQEKAALPWKRESPFIVGEYARERGAEVPARLISSAKSWLCNPRVNRRDPILPWNAPEGTKKISPLEAMSEYLAHARASWNHKNKHKLEDQQVIITIPASFDAAARDLIVEAAKQSGLSDVTLLEEPQAAFYSWITQSEAPWRDQIKKGDVVLVVDVGGGTTDFSLIAIEEENGDLALKRVAVGNHILLGGDNMDLTLAFHAKSKLEAAKKKIDTWQTLVLSHACRKAKENLLNNPELKSEPLVISGRGSSVIGGTMKTTLDRKDIESILIDGFFPPCKMSDFPREDTGAGFREVNLAYAADPAITRHLAKFLSAQGGEKNQSSTSDNALPSGDAFRYPKAILFNGGVFLSQPFRDRLIEVVNSWLKEAGKPAIKVLEGMDLTRAVAVGATAFGLARCGKGIRIRGGVSQSYYIGIESALPAIPGMTPPLKALCVAAQGMEEGSIADIENRSFSLMVGRPVEFKFFKANARRDDKPGQLLDDLSSDMEETSSLKLDLPAREGVTPGTPVSVTLQVAITEIGTLEIWCREVGGDGRWKLEFNVREAIK